MANDGSRKGVAMSWTNRRGLPIKRESTSVDLPRSFSNGAVFVSTPLRYNTFVNSIRRRILAYLEYAMKDANPPMACQSAYAKWKASKNWSSPDTRLTDEVTVIWDVDNQQVVVYLRYYDKAEEKDKAN